MCACELLGWFWEWMGSAGGDGIKNGFDKKKIVLIKKIIILF